MWPKTGILFKTNHVMSWPLRPYNNFSALRNPTSSTVRCHLRYHPATSKIVNSPRLFCNDALFFNEKCKTTIQLQVSRQVKKTNKNTTKSLSTSIFKNKKGCFLTLRCQSSVKILQIGVPEVPLHWHLCIFGHPPAWPKSPRMGTLGQGKYGGFGVVFSYAKKHLQMVQ